MSIGCIFVDIVGAYDAADRHKVFWDPYPVMEQLVGKSRSDKMFRNSYRNSWITVDGVKRVICTRKGARPGDPYADLTFNMLVTDALYEIDERLSSIGVRLAVPVDPNSTILCGSPEAMDSVEFSEISYIDDLVFVVMALTINPSRSEACSAITTNMRR